MTETVQTQQQSHRFVEVLVDCPGVQGLYTYLIPRDLSIYSGDILNVPFGTRQVGAIAIRLISENSLDIDSSQLREVDCVISSGFFSKDYWKLLEQVAHYYQTPLIQVIRTALPPGLLAKSQRRIRLNPDRIPENVAPFISLPAQQLLRQLQQSPTGDYTWQYLQRHHKGGRRALQQLLDRHWVESYLAAPQPPQPKQRQAVIVTDSSLLDTDTTLTPRQHEILKTLLKQGGELWLSDALQLLRTTTTTLKKLEAKGYLALEPREVLRVSSHSQAGPDRPKSLTPDQAKALEALHRCIGYTQILLHGVTGSGKTEVYLQAIPPYLAKGQSVLVLVPEIGLTPQLTDRFRSRFGEKVCVYHSALSDGERYDTWRQMLSGTPQIVIGTRSAIFVPLPHVGLIILDEEHDSSFKQDQPAPCYHARTVAQWRAQLADCPLILGSATPSLETWMTIHQPTASFSSVTQNGQEPMPPPPHLPTSPPPHYLPLPQRVHTRPLPPVEIVDMRAELHAGNRTIFSRSLQNALETMKASGNQGLLFIHRRGHSRFVSCRSCGYVMECPNCDVSLAYHQPHREATPYLRCHYCGYSRGQPTQCPDCSSPYLKHFGSGTQRVVNELMHHFPELRCIRFDSDTTRTKGAHRALLKRFAEGEADLLVGTQMLTKGIDLPQVTLVGVIAADGLLHMADYWAGERAFQTLTQVAGRAGRGDQPGRVIIQTYTPDHAAIEAVKSHNYNAFIQSELEHRQALNYPPFGRLVLLRLTSLDPVTVEKAAQTCAQSVSTLVSTTPENPYEILGPAPAPILRVAQRYRWHILLKFSLQATLPDLTSLKQLCPSGVSFTIDVDPLNLS